MSESLRLTTPKEILEYLDEQIEICNIDREDALQSGHEDILRCRDGQWYTDNASHWESCMFALRELRQSIVGYKRITDCHRDGDIEPVV